MKYSWCYEFSKVGFFSGSPGSLFQMPESERTFTFKIYTWKEINYNPRMKDILTLPKAANASFGKIRLCSGGIL